MEEYLIKHVRENSTGYTARIIAKERLIFPGYTFYAEIQKDESSKVKKVKIGKMGGSLGGDSVPALWGLYKIESIKFGKEGLTINFLKGIWGSGLEGLLSKDKKVISRRDFN